MKKKCAGAEVQSLQLCPGSREWLPRNSHTQTLQYVGTFSNGYPLCSIKVRIKFASKDALQKAI
jgi:hypothetical protein